MENENQNTNTNFEQNNVPEQNLKLNNVQVPEPDTIQEQNTRKGNNFLVVVLLLIIALMLGWFLVNQSSRGTDETAVIEDVSVVDTITSDTSTSTIVPSGTAQQTLVSFSADGLVSGTYMSSVVNAPATFTLVSHGDEYRCPTGQANTTQTYSSAEYASLNPTPADCVYVPPNIDQAIQNLLNHSIATALYGSNPEIESISVNGRIARLLTTDTSSPAYHMMVVLDTPVVSQGDLYSFLYITTENQVLISDITQSLEL